MNGSLPQCKVCDEPGALVKLAAFADHDGRWVPEWLHIRCYLWAVGFKASLGYW